MRTGQLSRHCRLTWRIRCMHVDCEILICYALAAPIVYQYEAMTDSMRWSGNVGWWDPLARPPQGQPVFIRRLTFVGLGSNKEVKLSLCGAEGAGGALER